jgi:hypothetical protein
MSDQVSIESKSDSWAFGKGPRSNDLLQSTKEEMWSIMRGPVPPVYPDQLATSDQYALDSLCGRPPQNTGSMGIASSENPITAN